MPDVQTIRRIPDVEQTFGGAFTPDSPELSRDTPECKKGSQPAWVGKAEEVSGS